MKESKVDNVEESQASIISIKEKNDKVEAYITYTKQKNDTVDKVEE